MQVMRAKTKMFHLECFRCAACRRHLGNMDKNHIYNHVLIVGLSIKYLAQYVMLIRTKTTMLSQYDDSFLKIFTTCADLYYQRICL